MQSWFKNSEAHASIRLAFDCTAKYNFSIVCYGPGGMMHPMLVVGSTTALFAAGERGMQLGPGSLSSTCSGHEQTQASKFCTQARMAAEKRTGMAVHSYSW